MDAHGIEDSESFKKLLERAAEVLGNRELAAEWFTTALPALNQKTPMEVIIESGLQGMKRIEELLGRIDYQSYS